MGFLPLAVREFPFSVLRVARVGCRLSAGPQSLLRVGRVGCRLCGGSQSLLRVGRVGSHRYAATTAGGKPRAGSCPPAPCLPPRLRTQGVNPHRVHRFGPRPHSLRMPGPSLDGGASESRTGAKNSAPDRSSVPGTLWSDQRRGARSQRVRPCQGDGCAAQRRPPARRARVLQASRCSSGAGCGGFTRDLPHMCLSCSSPGLVGPGVAGGPPSESRQGCKHARNLSPSG